jgi:hypothetical protein
MHPLQRVQRDLLNIFVRILQKAKRLDKHVEPVKRFIQVASQGRSRELSRPRLASVE